MRILVIILFSLLTSATAWTQSSSLWDVLPDSITMDSANLLKGGVKGWRDIPWGTPLSKVKASEGMDEVAGGGLMKTAMFGGIEDVIWLAFCGDEGLMAGAYFAIPDFTEPMRYIELYNQWQINLNGKYGDPSIQRVNWHNSEWREEVENGTFSFGWALENGYLSYSSAWIFEDGSAIAMGLDTEMPMMQNVPAIVLAYVKDLKSIDNEKW